MEVLCAFLPICHLICMSVPNTGRYVQALRPDGSRPKAEGPTLAAWPIGARPTGLRCGAQGASPAELLNLQSLLEHSNWALHHEQLGKQWLADSDEMVTSQPGYVPSPPREQGPSSAHAPPGAEGLKQQVQGSKRSSTALAGCQRKRRKLGFAAQAASNADGDDVTSARPPRCGQQPNASSDLPTDGAHMFRTDLSQCGRPGFLMGASCRPANQLPSSCTAAAGSEFQSMAVSNPQQRFRLTFDRSKTIRDLQPILQTCSTGLPPSLQGADTINVIRRCKVLDAPGIHSLMDPTMSPSLLANLANHFEVCGLQLALPLHPDVQQKLLSYFEVRTSSSANPSGRDGNPAAIM